MSDPNTPTGGSPPPPPPPPSSGGSSASASGQPPAGGPTPSPAAGGNPPPPPPPPAPAPAPAPDSTSAVNQQILGAVQASTDFVFGLKSQLQDAKPDGSRISAGAAIAYEKAAQAAAIAVQDAADYQRNVLSISTVAQGKALAMMLADQSKIPQGTVVFVLAMVASLAAALTAGQVGGEQTKMISAFPKA
jgi:hypothetical protein